MYDNRIGVSIDGETRVYEVSEIADKILKVYLIFLASYTHC